MPDPMLSALRRIVERADTTDGFDAGLSVDFIAEHGPALLARLEGCEALRAQYEAAIRVLRDINETADSRMDVLDGPDGRPVPDAWMRVHSMTAAVLSHPLAKEVTP